MPEEFTYCLSHAPSPMHPISPNHPRLCLMGIHRELQRKQDVFCVFRNYPTYKGCFPALYIIIIWDSAKSISFLLYF